MFRIHLPFLAAFAATLMIVSPAEAGRIIWPCSGSVSSPYGPRSSPCSGCSTFHRGIDIGVGTGTILGSPGNGSISSAGYDSCAGNMLIIGYGNGWDTRFFHCSAFIRTSGGVSRNVDVAKSGGTGSCTTGPHLHFECRKDGVAQSIPGAKGEWKTRGTEVPAEYPGLNDAPPQPPRRMESDFNGDGKDDLASFVRGTFGDVWVALSNGGSFNGSGLWNDNFCYNTEVPLVGDFNGDRKTDLVGFTRGDSGDAWVTISSGSGFYPSVRWHDWFAPYSEWPLVGDFNGDGKDDLVTFVRGSYGDVWVALSNGSSFNGGGGLWNDNFCFGTEIPAVGDFNGDGKDDLVGFTRGDSGDAWVCISSGSGFYPSVRWHDWFSVYGEIPSVGDFNGDGKDDLVCFTRGTSGDVWVALSNGSSFNGGGGLWNNTFCFGDEIPGVLDANGDGKDDLVGFTRGTSGDAWVAISSGGSFYGSVRWHDTFCFGLEIPQPSAIFPSGDFNP